MTPTSEHVQAYVEQLKAHDWSFEYSDSHAVWLRGWEERKALEEARRLIDPDYRIWNEHAPEQWQRHPPGAAKEGGPT